ncbi:MAG: SusC/RagA family TonB-linked outer membrane protein, partial [Bacteroidota bacterium]
MASPAVVGANNLKFSTPDNPRPLAEVLEELGRAYGVFFTYDATEIANKEVSFTPNSEESLDVAINRLLAETGLRYEAFSNKYFVLYEDSRRGRRESNRLRRKVRQLDRLERRKGHSGLGRQDVDQSLQLKQMQELGQQLAETQEVSGRVVNREGEPLIGVYIQLAGSKRGTVTDASGRFQLTLAEQEAALSFSYLGYRSHRQQVRRGEQIKVNMQSAETELPEVLIVGYGQVNAREATGSIKQIESDALTNRQGINAPHEWLRGRVAGVQVMGGNGAPGTFQSIRIRGGSSMNAGNEPLYVIDGIPVDNSPHAPLGFQPGRNPLNAINPDDVASVSVLKDAAASSIYGSRAANGVVLIETKKSRLQEKGKLTYHSWVSLSQSAALVDVLDGAAFRSLVAEVAPYRQGELGFENTDWQNAIQRTAVSQQHSLSFQRGNKTSSYRASLGYLDRQGITGDAFSRRLSSTLYLRQDVFDHQLRIEGDFKVASLQDKYSSNTAHTYAYSFNPSLPILDPSSPWGGYFEYASDLAVRNPVSELNQVRDESRHLRFIGDLKAAYRPNFLPGLTATIHLGNDITDGVRNMFAPLTTRNQFANRGEYRYAEQYRNSQLWESYLHYQNRLASAQLGFDLTAGYTYQHFVAEYPEEQYLGIESLDYNFGQIPISNTRTTREFYQENLLASFFGRANFDWQRKYYLAVSLRMDGSSRFSPKHRWATFPALSAAWRLSEESLLANRPGWIDELKLRAGWGLTGNQEIGDFEYLPT